MEFVPSSDPGHQNRRSSRVVQAVPLTVTGVDALGQPFKERTSTLLISCHGCKYQSKHYVPKNSTVTLEIPRPDANQPPHSVKGRVVFVQRPRTVRELFQIGVEFDTPGNIWGVAFPPADWFAYPEGASSKIPAPGPAATPAEKEQRLHAVPSPAPALTPPPAPAAEDKVEVPAPPPAPVSAAVQTQALARQVARMVAEAKQTLQQAAQEGVVSAIAQLLPSARERVEVQIREAADKAVQAALTKQAEETRLRLEAQVREAAETAAQAAAAKEIEDTRFRLEEQMRQAAERVAERSPAPAQAPSFDTGALERRWAERVERSLSDAAALLHVVLTKVGETQRAALAEQGQAVLQQVRDRADAEVQQALTNSKWAERFEQSISEAAGALNARLAEVGETQRAALAEQGQSVLLQVREQADAEVQQALTSLRKGLAEERQAAESSRKELSEVTARAEESVAHLSTVAEKTVVEAQQRIEGLTAEQAGLLAQRQQQAEEKLRGILERIRGTTDQALDESLKHAREKAAQFTAEFETAARASLAKAEEEIEAKSTEAIHTTFEALYKASEWYQKKAQTGMQSALEKARDQATEGLRERAGEISRVFASELDHYSRSYVEHTKGLLDEAGREATERSRTQLNETAQTTVASFSDEMHHVAVEKLHQFQSSVLQSFDQVVAHSEQRAAKARAEIDGQTEHSLAEFQRELIQRINQGVQHARQELEAQLATDRETLQQQWLDELSKAANEAVEEYKGRLQNASNSWLLASAATLSQHSQGVIQAMAEAAEIRLRETCSQVFTGLGESLRQRLLGISTDIAPGKKPDEKK